MCAGPFFFPIAASIYSGAYVLDDDLEAGCVEQPRHIRLLQNGAGNLGRTTCFFHIRYQPYKRERGGVAALNTTPEVWAGHSRQTGDTAFHYD